MKRTIALLFLLAARWPSAASAQPLIDPPPTVITLRPAAEPVPALKYRLVPEQIKLVPGNAAIYYHRGVTLMEETYSTLNAKEQARPGAFPRSLNMLATGTWLSCPIGEIQRDKARKYLESFQDALKEVELGALRSTCEWEFDQRQGMFLRLPEIQGLRGLGRLIQLKVRVAILDGKTDEAMHWIEIGLAMGRHVSQGPLVIQALVGVAIGRTMAARLEDLIEAPGGPSLYWALVDRPRPFIDMRRAMEGDRYFLEKELPGLNEVDRGVWSLDQARRFADTLRKLFAIVEEEPISGSDGAETIGLAGLSRRIGIAAMVAKIYPEAERALIARGHPKAQLEAMPVIQVAALYTMQEYQRLRDDSYKWMNVPFWQSFNRIDHAHHFTAEEKLANPLLSMMYELLRPILNVRGSLSPVRLERELDAIQCIEAIRLYAGAHEGKLPPTLEAITDSPVPLDPVTGKPFLYQVNGDSATLSGPEPPGFTRTGDEQRFYGLRYDLKLAR